VTTKKPIVILDASARSKHRAITGEIPNLRILEISSPGISVFWILLQILGWQVNGYEQKRAAFHEGKTGYGRLLI
jgi:hypothetical protein